MPRDAARRMPPRYGTAPPIAETGWPLPFDEQEIALLDDGGPWLISGRPSRAMPAIVRSSYKEPPLRMRRGCIVRFRPQPHVAHPKRRHFTPAPPAPVLRATIAAETKISEDWNWTNR